MRARMMSLRSFRDPILVALSLVGLWQVLHHIVGDSAITACWAAIA